MKKWSEWGFNSDWTERDNRDAEYQKKNPDKGLKTLQRDGENKSLKILSFQKKLFFFFFLSNAGIKMLITGLSTAEYGPIVTTSGH